ncbi:hypothetical protein FNF27_03391 [Cafeteria roenbergensis]|uniref:PH domain-containing protein n=1 Tax=Cafeteria roenbergensis TaxID=33653 RepID=A0A5A8EB05_CAFRO|nr:hypothetical protein FNF27_03391 [Cafeteria roenbergensis]
MASFYPGTPSSAAFGTGSPYHGGGAAYGTPGRYGPAAGMGMGEYHDEAHDDGYGFAPPMMDVAGHPLDEAKSRELTKIRHLMDEMDQHVGSTAQRIDSALGRPVFRAQDDGTMVPVGRAEGMARSRGSYRVFEIDPSTLPIKEGVMRIKTGRRAGFIGVRKYWPERVAHVSPHGELMLFESEDSSSPILTIQLGAGTQAEPDRESHKGAGVAFTFKLVMQGGEEHLISCDTEMERDLWLATIQAVARLEQEVINHNDQVHRAEMEGGAAMAGMMADAGYHEEEQDEAAAAAEAEQREAERAAREDFATRHVAYGAGITHGTRGEQTDFTVELQDEAGQPSEDLFQARLLSATLASSSLELDLVLEDAGDGRAVCYYTPPQTGQYELSIMVDGCPINGSPFEIEVDPAPTAPGMCLLEGDGMHTARVGDVNTIVIIARDQFKEQRAEGGDKWAVDFEGPARLLEVVDNGDGTYAVQYEVDLAHDAITSGGRRPPQLEVHIALLDPRYDRLTVDPAHPYGRPLKNMPLTPTIFDAGTNSALSASQLAAIAPAILSATAAHAARSGAAPSTPARAQGSRLPIDAPSGGGGGGGGAASSASSRPPPTPQRADAMLAALRTRLADAEAETESARAEAAEAVSARYAAEDALAAAQDRAKAAEEKAAEATARAEAAERRAAAAEEASARADGSNAEAQHIASQLTEQSNRLESFAHELEARQRALDKREAALRAEEDALAAGDRAATAASAGASPQAAGAHGRQAAPAGERAHTAAPSIDASLLEQARVAAEGGVREDGSLVLPTGGDASTAAGRPLVPGGGPASLASGPARSLDTAAMMASTYTGAAGPGDAGGDDDEGADDAHHSPSRAPDAGASAGAGAGAGAASMDSAAAAAAADAPTDLFTPEALALIEQYRDPLAALLHHYSKGADRISAGQFVRLLKDYDVVATFTTSKEVRAVFAAAAAAHGLDDVPEGEKIRLGFAAFVEAIGRLALVALGRDMYADMYPTMVKKLEVVLVVWTLGSQDKLDEIKAASRKRRGKARPADDE